MAARDGGGKSQRWMSVGVWMARFVLCVLAVGGQGGKGLRRWVAVGLEARTTAEGKKAPPGVISRFGRESEFWAAAEAAAFAGFSPDGRFVAYGGAHEYIWIWERANGAVYRMLRTGRLAIMSGAFSPDGRTVVTADEAGAVDLWDLATAQRRRWLNRSPHTGKRIGGSATA